MGSDKPRRKSSYSSSSHHRSGSKQDSRSSAPAKTKTSSPSSSLPSTSNPGARTQLSRRSATEASQREVERRSSTEVNMKPRASTSQTGITSRTNGWNSLPVTAEAGSRVSSNVQRSSIDGVTNRENIIKPLPSQTSTTNPVSANTNRVLTSPNESKAPYMTGNNNANMPNAQRTLAGRQFGIANNNVNQRSNTGSFYNLDNNIMGSSGYGGFGSTEQANSNRGSQMGSVFGSMGPSAFGSAARGSMYGNGRNYGSMYGSGAGVNNMNESNNGPVSGFGSMYGTGMNNTNAPPFGSMYGGYGSMYGGGGPMIRGSMYGPYGSMYGMNSMYGGGGSMYGGLMPNAMGSMYGRASSFNSYGGLSMYGSQFGFFHSLANSSMHSIGGLWTPPSTYKPRQHSHNEILVRAKQLTEAPKTSDAENDANKKDKEVTSEAKDKGVNSIKNENSNTLKKEVTLLSESNSSGKDATVLRNVTNNSTNTKSQMTNTTKTDLGNPSTVVVLTESATNSSRITIDKAQSTLSIQDGKTDTSVHFLTSEILKSSDMASKTFQDKLVFTDILDNIAAGHNAALIFVNANDKTSGKSNVNNNDNNRSIRDAHTSLMKEITLQILSSAIKGMANNTAVKEWKIHQSCGVMTPLHKIRDTLLASSSSSSSSSSEITREVKVGSNPIYGVCVMNLTSQLIRILTEGAEVFDKMLSTQYSTDDVLILQSVIVQQKSDCTLLSSLTVVSVKEARMAEAIATGDDRHVVVQFYKTIVGGPCRTAIVTLITGDKTESEEEVNALRAMMLLGTKTNLPPRSGNVGRFVTYTEEQIAKFTKELSNLNGSAKEKMEQTIAKLRVMVDDAKEVLEWKSTSPPKAYPIQAKTTDREVTKTDNDINAGKTNNNNKALTLTNNDNAVLDNNKTVGKKSNENKDNTDGTNVIQSIKRIAADVVNTVSANAANDNHISINCKPFQSIHRLVVFVDSEENKTSKTCKVKLNDDVNAFDVEECLNRTSPIVLHNEVIKSSELERLTRVFCAGFNVSIIAAECVTSAVPEKQFTWQAVRMMLSSLFTISTTTTTNAKISMKSENANVTDDANVISIQLSMSVTRHDKLIVDLLAPSAITTPKETNAQAISVVSSPLFGPLIDHVIRRELRSVDEVNSTMNTALQAASLHFTIPNTVIIANAVVKQIVRKDNNVMVSSLFAAVSGNTEPFTNVVEKKDNAPRLLYSYAFGGPSSTLTIVIAQQLANQEVSVNALKGQHTIAHVRTSGTRDGSVSEFVKYAKNSLEKLRKTVNEAVSGKEKASVERNVTRLEQSLKDYTELLNNPTTTTPAVYSVSVNDTTSSHNEAKIDSNNNNKDKDNNNNKDNINTEGNMSNFAPSAPIITQHTNISSKSNKTIDNDSKKKTDSLSNSPQVKTSTQVKERSQIQSPFTPVASQNNNISVDKTANVDNKAVDENNINKTNLNKLHSDNNINNSSNVLNDSSISVSTKEEGLMEKVAIKFVAVVTEQLRSGLIPKDGWTINTDGNKIIISEPLQKHTYETDEVIAREKYSSSIRSHTLDEARDLFMTGFNVAILTADAKGSTASLEMIDRTVRSVLAKLQPDMELYMSLCAFHEHERTVHDTLKSDDSFKPLELSTSPLFGPCISNAAFEKISTSEIFVKMMSSGLRFCGEHRACVILQLVLSHVVESEKDVMVSSMLGMMCPGDISIYQRALELKVKDRGILQLALGGTCQTIFASGFTQSPVDDSCLAIANLSQLMRASKNIKLRNGSIKQFIYHTKNALERTRKKIENANNDDEKKRLIAYETKVSNMLTEAENYLNNPLGKIPLTYVK